MGPSCDGDRACKEHAGRNKLDGAIAKHQHRYQTENEEHIDNTNHGNLSNWATRHGAR